MFAHRDLAPGAPGHASHNLRYMHFANGAYTFAAPELRRNNCSRNPLVNIRIV